MLVIRNSSIDNYIGPKALVILKDVVAKVMETIFSDNLGKGLNKAGFDDFCAEYGCVQLNRIMVIMEKSLCRV